MAVYQSLSLTQISQDIHSNTSQVRLQWQSTQTGGSFNDTVRTATCWVSVNGGTEQSETVSYTLPYRQTAVILDKEITVTHNDRGEALVSLRTEMDTHISAGVVRLQEQLLLDPIPRASTLRASDSIIGGISRIAVSKKRTDTAHSIAWQFGGLSGYLTEDGKPTQEECLMMGEQVDFLIPESFYGQIPDARQGVCTLTCRTYCGEESIGQAQTAVFTASVDESLCQPVLTASVTDGNENTLALTGDEKVLIAGHSVARCTMEAFAQKQAYLVQKTVAGVEITDGTEITAGESLPVFSVTDSRGFTARVTPTNPLIPYQKPVFHARLYRLRPTDLTAVLQIEGQWYGGSFGIRDNALQIECLAGGEWISIPVQTEGNSFTAQTELTGMDYTRVCTATVRLADCLTQTQKQLTLKKGVPVFDWGENDFAFHVPVAVEGGVSAQSFSVGGKALWETIYPVGAVYISTQATDPGVLFGGTWAKITDRFLLAAGETYPAGSQGGEAEHTLTVQELPSHAHTSYGWVYAGQSSGSVVLRADGEEDRYSTRQTGGDAPHNNMPPYLAVYMWRRTA